MKTRIRLICILTALLALPLAGLGAQPPVLEIFQGIVPTASGPGMEIVLYLYADGESYVRYQYLKVPGDWSIAFGTWTMKGKILTITPLMPDDIGFAFLRTGDILYAASPQGKELYPGLPRSVLVKTGG